MHRVRLSTHVITYAWFFLSPMNVKISSPSTTSKLAAPSCSSWGRVSHALVMGQGRPRAGRDVLVGEAAHRLLRPVVVSLPPVDHALVVHPEESPDPPEVRAVAVRPDGAEPDLGRVARRLLDEGVGALSVLALEARAAARCLKRGLPLGAVPFLTWGLSVPQCGQRRI